MASAASRTLALPNPRVRLHPSFNVGLSPLARAQRFEQTAISLPRLLARSLSRILARAFILHSTSDSLHSRAQVRTDCDFSSAASRALALPNPRARLHPSFNVGLSPLARAGMANNNQCPVLSDEYEYLGLIPSVPTNALTSLETRLQVLEERSNLHTRMFLDSVEDDIMFTASEVLKWAIKKQGMVEGQALHYFDKNPEVARMVLLSCRAFGAFGPNPGTEGLATFKVISQEIIQAGNSVAHFDGLELLERKVRKCTNAINEWPHLNTWYPNQSRVILNYPQFKAMLPECFQ